MYCTRIYCVLSITGLLLVLLVFGEAVLMKDVSVLGCVNQTFNVTLGRT